MQSQNLTYPPPLVLLILLSGLAREQEKYQPVVVGSSSKKINSAMAQVAMLAQFSSGLSLLSPVAWPDGDMKCQDQMSTQMLAQFSSGLPQAPDFNKEALNQDLEGHY